MNESAARMSAIVQFVGEYRWIYDIQVTKLFAEQWWKKIPQDWQDALTDLTVEELNQLPFGVIKDSWPSQLKRFISQSQHLSLSRSVHPSVVMAAVDVSPKVKVGMTPKKAHEVSMLAGLVREVCAANNCQVVLDIGSGLGYLGDCLCEECGLCVVGLERETDRLTAAKRREHSTTHDNSNGESCDPRVLSCDMKEISHDPQTPSCDSHAMTDWSSQLARSLPAELKSPFHVSIQLNIDTTYSSIAKLSQLLRHLRGLHHINGDLRVCVVGLHCCGDLSPSTLTLFTDHTLTSLTSLVLVGCCYHKTSSCQWMPSSETMRQILKERKDQLFNTFALRLAAQETQHRWQKQTASDHTEHDRRVAFRAMLEAVTVGKDLPRKALRRLKVTSIEDYAKAVATNLDDHQLEERLLGYHASHKIFIKLIEPFTALQVCLQGVLETLILEDRLCLLRERGLTSAKLTAVFDPSISPRNMAIVATKS